MRVAHGPPTQRPPRVSGEQRRDTDVEIVGEQGFQGVSIRRWPAEAGISRPIVYEHFGGLPGLLDTLVKREMARALNQVSETALGDLSAGDPTELMLESLRTYLAAVEDHPTTWRLVLTPPEGAPELLRRGSCAAAGGPRAAAKRSAPDFGRATGRPTPN